MKWYLVYEYRGNKCISPKPVDAVPAQLEDMALAAAYDRNTLVHLDHEFRVHLCIDWRWVAYAKEIYKKRNREIEVDECLWSVREFCEWMSQPAYQGAK